MKTSVQFLILILVCICTFFVDIQEFYPDIMEMRNFISAREMLTEGNWWSTTLNLEPRLEKPPLPTWLTAISVKYFGDFNNLFVARIPSAIVATLMVFFFYGFCRELSKEKYLPFIGALVLATSLLVVQQARVNSWDIYTHVFMLGSLWQFLVVKRNKKLLNIFWTIILFALSIYSKGPVSVYALWLSFIIALGFGENLDFLKKYKFQFAIALILALLLGFSWNIYMIVFQPEASDFVINKETNSWVNRHTKPFYFYLHFAIYIGIWTVFMISTFFYKYAAPRINRLGNYRFMIFWVLISIFLLSVIPTKKERYLLPALIPMCLIVTFLIYSIWQAFKAKNENKWDKVILTASSLLIYIPAILLPFTLVFVYTGTLDVRALIFAFLIGGGGIAGIVFLQKKQIESSFIIPIVIVCLFCIGLLPKSAEVFDNYEGYKGLNELQEMESLNALPFYFQHHEVDVKVVYAVGKPVAKYNTIDFSDENNFPLVLISYFQPKDRIAEELLSNLDMEYLGRYDLSRKKSAVKVFVNRFEYKKDL